MVQSALQVALGKRPSLLNAWVTLNSPLVIELLGGTGWDLVTLDFQHGAGDFAAIESCLVAARAMGKPALVRPPSHEPGLIARLLDAGAHGIVCPMVNTAEEAGRLVAAAKYPPLGGRSYGPYRASLMTKGDYFAEANGLTVCCAQIETAEAMRNLDAILATRGIDMALVGPYDLAISLSGGKVPDPRSPAVLKALDEVLAACRRHKVLSAIYCGDLDYATPLIAKGWQVVTIGCDTDWLLAGAAGVLRDTGRS